MVNQLSPIHEAVPTVFVVDDDQAVRRSLSVLIRSVGLEAETFGSAQEFLERYDPSRPGCLVLDIRMPGQSGLELQRTLNSRGVTLPIIIITGHGDVPIAVRAMKDGAIEFLEKPFSKQVLLERVGEALRLDAEARRQCAERGQAEARLALLTTREREVMQHVVSGQANKQIARDLGISLKTVEAHRAKVMRKLQVTSVPELVRLALRAPSTQPPVEPSVPEPVVAPAARNLA